jgi:hypothetical protein
MATSYSLSLTKPSESAYIEGKLSRFFAPLLSAKFFSATHCCFSQTKTPQQGQGVFGNTLNGKIS